MRHFQAEWVRMIPKLPKSICKRYFAVVQKTLFKEEGKALVPYDC